MTFKYYRATDSIVIRLRHAIGTYAEEIGPNIIADYDGNGRVIGLEIHHASKHVDLDEIIVATFPRGSVTLAS